MCKHRFLYLIWKDPKSRRNFTVGKLEKNETGYSFEYCNEFHLAVEAGWSKLQAFPKEQKYASETLFTAFSGRLPDPKRRNIELVLKKYGLDSYDGFELLRKSGGRLPIDTYEFIDPIFQDDQVVYREFYIAGLRHLSNCKDADCSAMPEVYVGEKLLLQMESDNRFDKYAIMVLSTKNECMGYIPRYYSESVTERLLQNMSYECTVIEISKDGNCECYVKVALQMPKL